MIRKENRAASWVEGMVERKMSLEEKYWEQAEEERKWEEKH